MDYPANLTPIAGWLYTVCTVHTLHYIELVWGIWIIGALRAVKKSPRREGTQRGAECKILKMNILEQGVYTESWSQEVGAPPVSSRCLPQANAPKRAKRHLDGIERDGPRNEIDRKKASHDWPNPFRGWKPKNGSEPKTKNMGSHDWFHWRSLGWRWHKITGCVRGHAFPVRTGQVYGWFFFLINFLGFLNFRGSI